MRVLKFTLQDRGVALVALPENAKILSVGDQCGALQLWALCDETMQEARRFAVLYTGFDEVPEGAKFIGTVLSLSGSMVRHVFEVPHA